MAESRSTAPAATPPGPEHKEAPPTYRERKLQRAFCDLTEAQKDNLETAQAIFERREGIPARATDIVRNSIREFCKRQGVEFCERRPLAKVVADAPSPPVSPLIAKPSAKCVCGDPKCPACWRRLAGT